MSDDNNDYLKTTQDVAPAGDDGNDDRNTLDIITAEGTTIKRSKKLSTYPGDSSRSENHHSSNLSSIDDDNAILGSSMIASSNDDDDDDGAAIITHPVKEAKEKKKKTMEESESSPASSSLVKNKTDIFMSSMSTPPMPTSILPSTLMTLNTTKKELVLPQSCSSSYQHLPSVDTLSTSSTTASSTTDTSSDECNSSSDSSNNNNIIVVTEKWGEVEEEEVDDNEDEEDDYHDCSSSMSSKDSYDGFVFSRYWTRTGQKPILFRPMGCQSSSTSMTSSSILKSSNSSSSSSSSSPIKSSSSPTTTLLCNKDYPLEEKELFVDHRPDQQDVPTTFPTIPRKAVTARRRSIFTTGISDLYQPQHPADDILRETTMGALTQQINKSASLSSLHNNRGTTSTGTLDYRNKTRSLTRLLSPSSTSISPGASCLRPFLRYHTGNNNIVDSTSTSNNSDDDTAVVVGGSGNKQQQQQNSSNNNNIGVIISSSLHSSTSIMSPSPSTMSVSSTSTSTSNCSVVRFDEAVDVRHFQPSTENYAQKGWSTYFH